MKRSCVLNAENIILNKYAWIIDVIGQRYFDECQLGIASVPVREQASLVIM